MDKLTRKWLKKRVNIVSKEIERIGLMNIEKLANNFKFDKRRLSNPDECPCYDKNVFCHDGNNKEKYCLLCSCPNYNVSIKEGGCLVENPFGKGYYYDRSKLGLNDIWDCSDCNYPHTYEETINALNLVKEYVLDEKDLKEVLWDLFKGELIDRE